MKPIRLLLLCFLALNSTAFSEAEKPNEVQTAEERIATLEAKVARLEEWVRKVTEKQNAPKAAITNKHGIPDEVLAKIKEKAESGFAKDNFSMQKAMIEAEIEAWKELNE